MAATEDRLPRRLSQRLAMAACTLLGAGNVSADTDWRVDGSVLSYTESDDRVAVSKTLVDLSRETGTNSVGVQLIHDTMSGASPTGAVRDGSGQVTRTGASGDTAGAGQYGTLADFDDARTQAGISVQSELDRTRTLEYGAVISQESDYDSLGANVGLSRTSADRNTIFDLGIAGTFDTIYRSGRDDTPEPLGNASDRSSFDKGQRSTLDALLGVTQVINRRTVLQLNLGVGASTGYHSDPYKVISVLGDDGQAFAHLHDSRPEQRLRTTLFAKLVHQRKDSGHSMHLSQRLYSDDWGVLSGTVDLRYRIELNPTMYLEPHVRGYRQSAADFYAPSLRSGTDGTPALPDDGYASADYRLDAMSSVTLGLKYGLRIGARTELRLRAAWLDQRFDSAAFDRLSALILQGSAAYRF